jgi:hypothetical protein
METLEKSFGAIEEQWTIWGGFLKKSSLTLLPLNPSPVTIDVIVSEIQCFQSERYYQVPLITNERIIL